MESQLTHHGKPYDFNCFGASPLANPTFTTLFGLCIEQTLCLQQFLVSKWVRKCRKRRVCGNGCRKSVVNDGFVRKAGQESPCKLHPPPLVVMLHRGSKKGRRAGRPAVPRPQGDSQRGFLPGASRPRRLAPCGVVIGCVSLFLAAPGPDSPPRVPTAPRVRPPPRPAPMPAWRRASGTPRGSRPRAC